MTTAADATNTTKAAATTAAATTTPSAAARKTSLDSFSSDQFLHLLIAQLKYQDPASPTDPSAFMQQTAQFTQLETLQKIQKQLSDEAVAQQSTAATSMIGKKITGRAANATTDITGVVTSVSIGTSGPVVKIGDVQVPYASIKEVTTATKSA